MPNYNADDLYGGYNPDMSASAPVAADNSRYVAPVQADSPAPTGAPQDPAQGVLSALYAADPHAADNPLNAPGAAAAAANADGEVHNGTSVLDPNTGAAPQGVFSKILQGLKVAGPDGKVDYSDPNTMQSILKSVGVLGNILTTLQGPQNVKSASQLQASLKSPFDTWNPTQQAAADKYFSNPTVGHALTPAGTNPSAVVATRRYAVGGGVEPGTEPSTEPGTDTHVTPGALSLIHGQGGGQDDVVHALVAPGEYVWDADTVSALGDGNNAHGAQVLDKFREELRAHKRSAPATSIPPKAKAPAAYLSAAQRKGVK